MSIDLNAALALAEDCARRAGALLREAVQRPIKVMFKGAIDIVTESDRESEALITQAILSVHPDHHIIGEEGGGAGAPKETAPYRWHIDPIDGTTNFARGLPHFSVSIGLSGPDDMPLAGVVYDPMLDECFKAVRGGGATLNGKALQVSKVRELGKAMLISGFPYDRRITSDNNAEEWTQLLRRTQALRCLGSASLDICYVAAGRADGFWESRINSWDVMAGLLCVTEAGGQASNYHGGLDGLYQGKEVAATNGLIHDEMLAVIILGPDAPLPKERRPKK